MDHFITSFKDAVFQNAFKEYFQELGINVKDWNSLFKEMDDEKDNAAFVRVNANQQVIGFIQFKEIILSNWFFEERIGFIREFWVKDGFRNQNYGAELLALAEEHFKKNGLSKTILTTETAEKFYLKHGYKKDFSYTAKNNDIVFIKFI